MYSELLAHVAALRDRGDLWMALPREVDEWWRSRHAMTLVSAGIGWRVEGAGSERARVAYATLAGGHLEYHVEEQVVQAGMTLSRRIGLFASFTACLIAATFGVWRALFDFARHDDTASHVVLIPFVTAALIFQRRETLFASPAMDARRCRGHLRRAVVAC